MIRRRRDGSDKTFCHKNRLCLSSYLSKRPSSFTQNFRSKLLANRFRPRQLFIGFIEELIQKYKLQ